jgi:hypothetical protein
LSSAPEVRLETVVQRTRPVEFAALDEDWPALDVDAACFYSLNEVGMRTWTLIECPTPVAPICTELGRDYAVGALTCHADLIEVLSQLAEAGPVVTAGPGGAEHA